MDCSPPGSSIHGIFQARVLEWGVIAFSVILLNLLHFYLTAHLHQTSHKNTEVWLFLWVCVSLWRLPGQIHFIVNIFICFFPISLSLSAKFSDPPSDPKRVMQEVFLSNKVMETHEGKDHLKSKIWSFCKCILYSWLPRKCQSLSRTQLFTTKWTAADQATLSIEFSRQEHWSWKILLQGVFLTWRSNPGLLHCREILYQSHN